MARDGDRRGQSAPRRSPQELAETLATLAASTPEPPPRPRRAAKPKVVADPGAPTGAVLEPDATATLAPEVEVETPLPPQAPAPASDPPAPAFDDPAPASDAPAPAPDPPAPAPDAPAPALVAGARLDERRELGPSDEVRPRETKPRGSNGAPRRARVHSRAGGRVWRRPSPSRSGRGLRIGTGRRSRTQRSRGDRATRGSRNLRKVYASLIAVLVIVVVVGLLGHGGGGATTSTQSHSDAQSVFPTPSTVPAPAPPPAVAPTPTPTPTPTVPTQSTAPQPKSCRPLQVNGRAVSVSIVQGQVSCRSARAVVLAFKSGKGRHGGAPPHRYRTVRGWQCVPSGTCTRPGKSIKAS